MSSGMKTRNSMSSWNILLLHMLLILLGYGVESREIMNKSLEQSMTHMDMSQNDPWELIFFTEKYLKMGQIFPMYFPKKDPSRSPRLLPRAEADSIPFSSGELPKLLDLFSLDQGSPQAEAVEYTLTKCETEPIKGETKTCATSLESVIDFARGAFGPDERFSLARTRFAARSASSGEVQGYTVSSEPIGEWTPRAVACHLMPYPYLVYFCHYKEGKNKMYRMSLSGESGDLVEAVTICHMDTSDWSRDHEAFRVLGIEPGTAPVCHLFPEDNLVWIPKSSTSSFV